MRQELKIARRIQQGYLPIAAPLETPFGGIPGLDLAGWCETAQSVGGDYYDFLLPDPDNFYVVVADVSGHNIASALTMAHFRSQLRSALFQEREAGKILEILNGVLFDDLANNDQFISVVLARFRLKEEKIEVALAGHRPPLFLRNGAVETDTMAVGAVLGALQGETYALNPVTLGKNEGLLFYTDGATEMDNEAGMRLGISGLQKVIKPYLRKGTVAMLHALKKELKDFRGAAPVRDDVTLVAVKRN